MLNSDKHEIDPAHKYLNDTMKKRFLISGDYKKISCSTKLNMKFQLLIKSKIMKNNIFSCLKHSGDVFIVLINVKMATIVAILTFMSRINFMLS